MERFERDEVRDVNETRAEDHRHECHDDEGDPQSDGFFGGEGTIVALERSEHALQIIITKLRPIHHKGRKWVCAGIGGLDVVVHRDLFGHLEASPMPTQLKTKAI